MYRTSEGGCARDGHSFSRVIDFRTTFTNLKVSTSMYYVGTSIYTSLYRLIYTWYATGGTTTNQQTNKTKTNIPVQHKKSETKVKEQWLISGTPGSPMAKTGYPFHASSRAPSYWPTPAQTRLLRNLKRVHPILATHPSIGCPISFTPTRLWPGYSTSSPRVHASSRHRGTRRVIFADDVVVRAAEL